MTNILNIQAAIRLGLVACFNLGELATLCSDLGIHPDDLSGNGLEEKARELIGYMERRGRLRELIRFCKEARPTYPWPQMQEDIGTLRNSQSTLENELSQGLLSLTPREISVLMAVSEDKSLHEIASELGIATSSAKSHLVNLRHKLKVSTRAQLQTLAHLLKNSCLTIDTKPLVGAHGSMRYIPFDALLTVSDLLDEIWGYMDDAVPPYTYGSKWILRNSEDGRCLDWLLPSLNHLRAAARDLRTLKEAGLTPGTKLEAIPTLLLLNQPMS